MIEKDIAEFLERIGCKNIKVTVLEEVVNFRYTLPDYVDGEEKIQMKKYIKAEIDKYILSLKVKDEAYKIINHVLEGLIETKEEYEAKQDGAEDLYDSLIDEILG